MYYCTKLLPTYFPRVTQHKTIKMRRTTAPKTQPSIIANLLLLSSSSVETNQKKLSAPNMFLDTEPICQSFLTENLLLTAVFSRLLKNITYLACKPGDN